MADACPCCGQAWPAAQRVERELALLREWIARENVRVMAGRIAEADAARYLGRQPRTLRYWRDGERPLPYSRVGGRVLYQVEDIAVLLVDSGEW